MPFSHRSFRALPNLVQPDRASTLWLFQWHPRRQQLRRKRTILAERMGAVIHPPTARLNRGHRRRIRYRNDSFLRPNVWTRKPEIARSSFSCCFKRVSKFSISQILFKHADTLGVFTKSFPSDFPVKDYPLESLFRVSSNPASDTVFNRGLRVCPST